MTLARTASCTPDVRPGLTYTAKRSPPVLPKPSVSPPQAECSSTSWTRKDPPRGPGSAVGTALKTVPVPDTGQEQFITGGDLIVAIDGKPASSWDTYYQILDKYKPGDIVTVRLYRGRTLVTVKAQTHGLPLYRRRRPNREGFRAGAHQ